MNVAFVGSRNWPWKRYVQNEVATLATGDIVVSGGAHGVDTIAENAAKDRGLETLIFIPDWDSYGKSAGFRRNIDIVKVSHRMIAFQYEGSKGTQHSINLAKSKGIPVKLYEWTEKHGMQVKAL